MAMNEKFESSHTVSEEQGKESDVEASPEQPAATERSYVDTGESFRIKESIVDPDMEAVPMTEYNLEQVSFDIENMPDEVFSEVADFIDIEKLEKDMEDERAERVDEENKRISEEEHRESTPEERDKVLEELAYEKATSKAMEGLKSHRDKIRSYVLASIVLFGSGVSFAQDVEAGKYEDQQTYEQAYNRERDRIERREERRWNRYLKKKAKHDAREDYAREQRREAATREVVEDVVNAVFSSLFR